MCPVVVVVVVGEGGGCISRNDRHVALIVVGVLYAMAHHIIIRGRECHKECRLELSARSSLGVALCDSPSGCCSFTGPWTVTRSSLRMLRWVAAFCRPLRPVLLLVSFPRSRSPVVGVLGLCWLRRDVPFGRQRRPVVGASVCIPGGGGGRLHLPCPTD